MTPDSDSDAAMPAGVSSGNGYWDGNATFGGSSYGPIILAAGTDPFGWGSANGLRLETGNIADQLEAHALGVRTPVVFANVINATTASSDYPLSLVVSA
jgi:hypothetical protein